jgi:Base plate wedge protein 53
MFFGAFPKTAYTFNFKEQNPDIVTNIFSRVRMRTEVLQNSLSYYKYQVQDGDTPEIVSYKEYGSPDYHWIICLVNNMSDPLFEFPLEESSLQNYIISKYAYANIDVALATTHHYELVRDNIMVEVYGPTTKWTDKFEISLDQYTYSSNTIVTQPLNTPVTVTTNFRANNSDPLSAITSTLTTTSTYKAVNVYDYETEQNENKRTIKLLKREYIQTIVSELGAVING